MPPSGCQNQRDIDEEGIGSLIRGTWLIKDVPVREARQLGQDERRVAEIVGSMATTAEDFDRLAHAVEDGYDPDDPDERYALTSAERAGFDEFISDDETAALDSLELGVAGLVYALATVCVISAASCRGHPGDHAWSDVPSYCSRRRSTGPGRCNHSPKPPICRFGIDAARPELLAVQGRSILDTMALADAVLGSRRMFVQPRPARGTRPAQRHDEERLF